MSNYWKAREVVGLEHLYLKDCFIKYFFLLEVVNPMHAPQNMLAMQWICGQLQQEEVPITFLLTAVMNSLDIKNPFKNKKPKKPQLFMIRTMQKGFIRQLIGVLPRGKLAVMSDNTVQRFLF